MTPLHILIVDADPLLGEQLRGLLLALGHRALLCPDPDRALQLADELSFDLILCDYWVPTTTGRGAEATMPTGPRSG